MPETYSRPSPGPVGAKDRPRLRLLVFLYRTLVLPAHPRELRQEYGNEVVGELRESLRDAAARGQRFLPVWLRALADVVETRRLAARPLRRGSVGRSAAGTAASRPVSHRRSRAPSAPRAGAPPSGYPPSGLPQRPPSGAMSLDRLLSDLRYAIRSLRRQPGFLVAAVAVLAVGIGANTAVFSVANAYLFRALPYPEPDRLARVAWYPRGADFRPYRPILQQLTDVAWPARDEVLEHVAAWDLDGFTLLGGDQPESVDGAWVTPGYFGALGVEPALGRVFSRRPATGVEERGAVISHDLWKRVFGGDPGVLGRVLTVYSTDRPEDGESFTVIGVLGADFWYFNPFTDLLLPLRASRTPSLVRLRDGVTHEQAAAHLTAIANAQIDTTSAPDWHMDLEPAAASYLEQVRPVLIVLVGVVALVLLIACGNVAILLLVRAVDREHEISLRRAIGASHGSIFGQLFTEGLVLAVIAGAVGLLLAAFALDGVAPLIEQQLGTGVPGGIGRIGIDSTVLLVTLVLSLTNGVIFGLVPALTGSRGGLGRLLNEGLRGGSDSPRRRALRDLLIVGEVGLSLALLVGAGLMARSALHLTRLTIGFDPENLLQANISLRSASYPAPEDRLQFAERLLQRASALPEVDSVSLVSLYPPFRDGAGGGTPVQAEGSAVEDAEASVFIVTPGYFETMGIPIIRGRTFAASDDLSAPLAAIVSRRLAERLWPGQDPLGRRIRAGSMATDLENARWGTVVGVVGEVRKSLTDEPVPDLYANYRQSPVAFFWVTARAAGDPLAAVPGLQRVVWGLNPDQPIGQTESVATLIEAAGARPRFVALALTGFALFAACLALFGLYAVVAYAVARRERDVAVRIALGARRDDVIRLFVKQGSFVVLVGMATGLVAAAWLTRAVESQLHGVAPLDPPTYAAACLGLLAAAMLAIWWPARRAAGCDPMRILRKE